MSDNSSREFNRRLHQWVASQGIFFQMRYSLSEGAWYTRLLANGACLGMLLCGLLLVAALAFWVYLYQHSASARYMGKLESQLEQRLSAEELDLRGNYHADDRLHIARIAAEGGAATFFESLVIYNLSCDMGLLETFTGGWGEGQVHIGKLDMHLRAGADDGASAAAMSRLIFGGGDDQRPSLIEIARLDVDWGFSQATQGRIRGSRLTLQRANQDWRLTFQGGSFSQNWLRNLEIVELVAVCSPGGIVFEKAEFSSGNGLVSMSGLEVRAGSQPELSGKLVMQSMPLASLMPGFASPYLDGVISGELEVSGSPNSTQGVTYEGHFSLKDGDRITIHDELQLIKALSVMDYSRNYNRVDFTKGSLDFRSGQGVMRFSNINLSTKSEAKQRVVEMILLGGFQAAAPDAEQIREAVEDGLIDPDALPPGFDQAKEINLYEQSRDSEILSKLGETDSPSSQDYRDEPPLFKRLALQLEARRLRASMADKLSSLMRYEGVCTITLPADAFERAQALMERYPPDASSGRIHIEVPVSGKLGKLTAPLADEIYRHGRR